MSIVKRNNLFFPSLMNDIVSPDWFGGTEKWNTSIPAVNIKDNTEGFVNDSFPALNGFFFVLGDFVFKGFTITNLSDT